MLSTPLICVRWSGHACSGLCVRTDSRCIESPRSSVGGTGQRGDSIWNRADDHMTMKSPWRRWDLIKNLTSDYLLVSSANAWGFTCMPGRTFLHSSRTTRRPALSFRNNPLGADAVPTCTLRTLTFVLPPQPLLDSCLATPTPRAEEQVARLFAHAAVRTCIAAGRKIFPGWEQFTCEIAARCSDSPGSAK